MMTSNKLIETANTKGYKVNTEYPNEVGIQFPTKRYSGLWHWFHIHSDGTCYFTHSYSQNTGKSFKGTMHRIKIQDKLNFYAS